MLLGLIRSTWALSYATLSFSALILTGVAITGAATKSRPVNLVFFLMSNQLSEMPLMVMLLDAFFYMWLKISGTFQASALVRFFYYINIITAIGLLYLFNRSLQARETVQEFLGQLSKESKQWVELPGIDSPRFWRKLLNPLHAPKKCHIYPDIPYWTQPEQLRASKTDGWESVLDMALDIYQPLTVQGGADRPVLLYIHGGGWTQGSKSIMGPLVTEMVSVHEWVVVSIDYRLKTKAGYPTQLLDCKRALRWCKDEIRCFGGDPDKIIVAGDSSGGQLAALLATTANVPEYQPGFEDVDTTVQGCLPLSASLDLTDLNGHSHHEARTRFIQEVAHRQGSGETLENMTFLKEHSPMFRIQSTGVPFLVVHGDQDIMTPVQIARDFVSEFRSKCSAPIHYLEVPGGNHCFHVLSSPRSWYTTYAMAEWLNLNFDRPVDREPGWTGIGKSVSAEQKKNLQVHETVEWGW